MKNIMPTPFIGFDIESVESWDFHPEIDEALFPIQTEQDELQSLTTLPMLEIVFKSGQIRRLYKQPAEVVFELLRDTALPTFGGEQ